jgi:hypothetical protein
MDLDLSFAEQFVGIATSGFANLGRAWAACRFVAKPTHCLGAFVVSTTCWRFANF